MMPIRIKLTYEEMRLLRDYCGNCQRKAYNPQAADEHIVLAEYYPTIERRLVATWRRDKRKAYPYSMPMSVARILHRRWQQEPITPDMQIILGGIDYELTDRMMKSDPAKPTLL